MYESEKITITVDRHVPQNTPRVIARVEVEASDSEALAAFGAALEKLAARLELPWSPSRA